MHMHSYMHCGLPHQFPQGARPYHPAVSAVPITFRVESIPGIPAGVQTYHGTWLAGHAGRA